MSAVSATRRDASGTLGLVLKRPERPVRPHAALLADIDLLHRQRISLEQPPDHVGGRHGLRLGASVGDGLLGKGLDPRLDPGEFRCLPHGVGVPLSKADLGQLSRQGEQEHGLADSGEG